MEKLTQLIKTLSKKEVGLIRKYLDFNGSEDGNYRLELFNAIVKGDVADDSTAAKIFTRKAGDSAYIMLKKRLKDDILKVLVWRNDLQKFKSKYFEARYKCRLLIAQADMLILRGATKVAIDCLYKAKSMSEKYELTNELVIINDLLISQVALKEGFDSYSKIAESSVASFDLIKNKFKAQDYLRQLTMPNLFQVNKDFNYKEESVKANQELKKLSELNDSIEIKFWYLRSEVYIHHLINDYESACEYGEQFLQLVRDSPVVYSMDNLGGACMQLAIININLKHFESAERYSEEAINAFVKGSNNQLNAFTYIFLSQLYNRKLDKARLTLDSILSSRSYNSDPFAVSKWNYYKANLLFAQGMYDDALALLQKESELISDKSGWRIGFKILEMMCIIELGHFDWLDFRIETFRKLLGDIKNENIARPKLIHQILKSFIRNMYDFNVTTLELKEHFEWLNSNEQPYKWDPIGYELVPFHSWWLSKLKSTKAVA